MNKQIVVVLVVLAVIIILFLMYQSSQESKADRDLQALQMQQLQQSGGQLPTNFWSSVGEWGELINAFGGLFGGSGGNGTGGTGTGTGINFDSGAIGGGGLRTVNSESNRYPTPSVAATQNFNYVMDNINYENVSFEEMD